MMPSIKRVIDYSKMSYTEVLELPTNVFKLMLKHSVIDSLMQTEEGQKYLKKCERLKATTPDFASLRKKKEGR